MPNFQQQNATTVWHHWRMTWGGHGLLKVLRGPTMPYLSTPCGLATPKMALRPCQGWPARRTDNLRLSSNPLDTPCRTSMSLAHPSQSQH
jgi:hypothetical protein